MKTSTATTIFASGVFTPTHWFITLIGIVTAVTASLVLLGDIKRFAEML